MYILGTYQYENPVLVCTEYIRFLGFRTDMYKYILSMYLYEHFQGVSSRVSGFQMVPDYQPVMPSQVRRLVSPYNPSYTPTENIVPAGLRLPNRMTRSTTPGPGAVCLGTSGGDGAHRRSHEPTAEQPEVEAELGLGRGHVTHMAGLDGGHGWDNARQGK